MAEQRCDLTDLLVSSCSHCRGLDKAKPGGDCTVGARFEARYGGRCPLCDNGFREGDIVGYLDDDVCCDACYDTAWASR
jgi:hypothetical protein